jgi:hypothetical protein
MMRYSPSGGNLAPSAEEQEKHGRKNDVQTVKRLIQALLRGVLALLRGVLPLFDHIFKSPNTPTYIASKPDAPQPKPQEVQRNATFRNVTSSYKEQEPRTHTSDLEAIRTEFATFLEAHTPNLQSLQTILKENTYPTTQPTIPVASNQPVRPATDLPSSVPETFMPTYEDEQAVFTTKAQLVIPAKPRLIILSPFSDDIHEVTLEKDSLTLGNASSNDIVLDKDATTSPYHALLREKDGDYYLFERRSDNGVFVNREQLAVGVGGHKLTDGDQITIGQYRLIFSNPAKKKPTKQMARPSVSKRITLPKMLTLPAKRKP